MDQDEGIRTLLRWFGYRPFRISELSDERVQEIARLVGAVTLTPPRQTHPVGQAAHGDGRLQVFDGSKLGSHADR